MFPVSSSTSNVQQSPKTSPVSSRHSTPERRESVGSNDGVLGVGSVSTPIVDELLRSQLQMTSVDPLNRSGDEFPNAEHVLSNLYTPDVTRRRSDSLVGSVQEDVNRDSDVLLNAEEFGIDFLGDEHRDQPSPLPNFPKSAMKQKRRESLDSIRSETERYLSPTMKKMYRESKGESKGISTVIAYSLDHSDSVEVRELFSRTQRQVHRATEYRQELETSIQSLELELGNKETQLREITMRYTEKVFELGALSNSIDSLKDELRSQQEALRQVKGDLEVKNKEKESLKKIIQNLGSQQRTAELRLSELMQKLEGKETLNVDEAISAKTNEIEYAYAERFQVLLKKQQGWQDDQQELFRKIESQNRRIEEADDAIEQEKRNTELAKSASAAQTKRIAELTNQNDAYVKEIEAFKVQLQQLSLQLGGLNRTTVPVSRSAEMGSQIQFDEDAITNGRFRETRKVEVLLDKKESIPSRSNRRLSGVSMGEEDRVENEQEKLDHKQKTPHKQKAAHKQKTATALNGVLDSIL